MWGHLWTDLFQTAYDAEQPLNSTVWFQFKWLWCSLNITGLQGKQELVLSLCCKVAWSYSVFIMVDFVRKIAVRRSYYSLLWWMWIVWTYVLLVRLLLADMVCCWPFFFFFFFSFFPSICVAHESVYRNQLHSSGQLADCLGWQEHLHWTLCTGSLCSVLSVHVHSWSLTFHITRTLSLVN